jgi:hypothetical protein
VNFECLLDIRRRALIVLAKTKAVTEQEAIAGGPTGRRRCTSLRW